MDKSELAKLKELAECANPGPWKCALYNVETTNENWLICEAESVNDGRFIAAANPQAILGLIADYERLQEEAYWLATYLADTCAYVADIDACPANEASVCPCEKCKDANRPEVWREAARKAVESGNG